MVNKADMQLHARPAASALPDGASHEVWQSFSRMLEGRPAAVRRVVDRQQAQDAISEAFAGGMAVNFRGAGHSFGDHCISSGGVLLLNGLHRPVERLDTRAFSVSGGSTWLATEIMLNAHGRSAPVLSNWLQVTVAGTLAAGGYGWSSLRYGGQIDNIEQVTLVDCNADIITIGPDDGDAWKIASACAGRFGFLTDCVLATVPASPFVSISVKEHQTIEALAVALREDACSDGAPEMAWAQVKEGSLLQFAGGRSEGVTARPLLNGPSIRSFSMTWTDWLIKHSHREFADDVKYAWSDYVLPSQAFVEFVTLAWQSAFEGPFASAWRPRMRLLVMDRKIPMHPEPYLSASRLATPGARFGVGVYLEPTADNAAATKSAKGLLAECLDRCTALGGRPYLGSWHELDETMAQRIYGEDLRRARAVLDASPNSHLMNPGNYPRI
jgi:hypothetical protein